MRLPVDGSSEDPPHDPAMRPACQLSVIPLLKALPCHTLQVDTVYKAPAVAKLYHLLTTMVVLCQALNKNLSDACEAGVMLHITSLK